MTKPFLTLIIHITSCTTIKNLQICLDSINSQDNKNFETILVFEDHSTENLELCKSMTLNNCNFKLIINNFDDYSIGRNFAIKEANGKYLFFLTASHCMSSYLCNSFSEFAMRTSADMVYVKHYDRKNNGNIESKEKEYFLHYDLLNKKDVLMHFSVHLENTCFYSFFYKKDLLIENNLSHIQNDFKNFHIVNRMFFLITNLLTLPYNQSYIVNDVQSISRLENDVCLYYFQWLKDNIDLYCSLWLYASEYLDKSNSYHLKEHAHTIKTNFFKTIYDFIVNTYVKYQTDFFNAMMQMDELDNKNSYIICRTDASPNLSEHLKQLFSQFSKEIYFFDCTNGKNEYVLFNSKSSTPMKIEEILHIKNLIFVLLSSRFFNTYDKLYEFNLISNFGELMPLKGKTTLERCYQNAFNILYIEKNYWQDRSCE